MRNIDLISIVWVVLVIVVVIFQIKYERTCLSTEKECIMAYDKILKETQLMYEQYLNDSKAQYNIYLEQQEEKYQQHIFKNNKTYREFLARYDSLRNVTCNMYGVNKTKILMKGYYSYDGFYCVATLNRSYCDVMSTDPNLDCINKTAFHELTHATVAGYFDGFGKEHFCERYNG